ncbi:MAG: 30S ribosomal protein S12 methylthiotransferase RimO [Oligoflexia bacterium]|nr:30S ribosomal protein S12 methylthiotransferase RimO [Oligoflexia bacterium]
MKSKLGILDQGDSCTSRPGLHLNCAEGKLAPGTFRGRAALVTLGCAKNQVDSEVMLGVLAKQGFEIVNDLQIADVAIVNTCGFLQSSVKESIDCILDVGEYKKKGQLRKLIVAGCLVERYRGELRESLPEVDRFLSIDEILKVGEAACGEVGELLRGAERPYFLYDDSMPRHLSTLPHTAYVKISEGCNRPCTFCIIPKLRGSMRSRTLDSLVREVRDLGERGVREINLVAQDLTSYGRDLQGPDLLALLKALDQTKAVDWIRLLYAYPVGITAELLAAIVDLPHVCNYLDLPMQHSSEAVLRQMKRPVGRYAPRALTEFIRKTAPQIALRTTLIVGFPGETESDILDLENFISEGHFSSVGVFTYSQEQGTDSHDLPMQLEQQVKDERRERIMLAQQRVVEKRLQAQIGSTVEVLIDGLHEDTDLLVTGRASFQAPDVDGTVIINDLTEDLGEVRAGMLGQVEITDSAGYDLVGTLISVD